MGRAKHFGGLAAATILAACATPGPKESLEPIEAELDAWASVAAERQVTPVTANWLAELGDPMVKAIVTDAVRSNFDLQARAQRVNAQRQRARVTRADLLPTLGFGINAVRARNPSGGGVFVDGQVIGGAAGTSGGTYTNTYTGGFDLRWELDLWGRLTDRTRAAYLDAAAFNLDYAAAQLSVAGRAAQGHYNLTAARLLRQLAERDVETGEANLRIIERRYNRGISTSLDLRLARSSLSSSVATLQQRKQQEIEAARQLEVLLGQYPAGSIVTAENLPDLPPLPEGGSLALGSPQSLLDRRPDVIASERRLKAAGLRVSEARKAFLPTLNLSASLTERAFSGGQQPIRDANGEVIGITPVDNADFPDLFDVDNLVKQFIASAAQPLFQGGRLIANERAAKDEARGVLADYANTALTAWQEVENAITAEKLLAARKEALETAFREAAAAEELTERRYLAGTANIFDLINAQQRRIQAEGQLIDAKRARLNNRVDLYLALGAPYVLKGEETLATADLPSAESSDGKGDVI
jgi:outer membrane protein TolC